MLKLLRKLHILHDWEKWKYSKEDQIYFRNCKKCRMTQAKEYI